MEKAKQAVIRMEMIDGMCNGEIRGTKADIGNTILTVFLDYAGKDAAGCRMLRKAARIFLRRTRSQTLPDWAQYWLDGLPFTLFGAGVIAAAIYGLSWVAHWLGVC